MHGGSTREKAQDIADRRELRQAVLELEAWSVMLIGFVLCTPGAYNILA